LIDGYEDGTFRPNQNIKRDEAMKIINKVLFRTPDKEHFLPDMITWPDNSDTDAWYYTDVQEATNNHDYERVNNTSPETWTQITPARDWKALEAEINAWPGVVTVGLFAARGADVLLLGTQEGVQTFERG
jgi:hypothetical protein